MMNDLKFTTAETYMESNKMQSAFPDQYKDGMTLRDYFASKALQPIAKAFLEKELDLEDPNGWMDGLAYDAYRMADAMLKAREE
jgi:hypothetical protein